MIVKVCGMRDADNIRQLDEIRMADWIGFIFFAKSPRNVEVLPDYLPQNSKRVGVFVNEPIVSIMSKVEEFGLDMVQLHGNETPEYCSELKEMLSDKVGLIKAMQISSSYDLETCNQYETEVDYFLFETKCENYGGSGRQFDWSILDFYYGSTPFILTGGIGPDDVEKIKTFSHPKFVGIDLNSKFETTPACKDIDMLNNFIKEIKSK